MNSTLGLVVVLFGIAGAPQQASAQDPAPVAALKQELQAKLPRNWQVRVRWRDRAVLASFIPPYQEGFDLWYTPEKLLAKMKSLCPAWGDAVWGMLKDDEDIVMEPTVGGKTVPEMRVSCRA